MFIHAINSAPFNLDSTTFDISIFDSFSIMQAVADVTASLAASAAI